jgi:hypothetical protein
MKRKRGDWRHGLTLKQKSHLRDCCLTTKRMAVTEWNRQKAESDNHPELPFVCLECLQIAHRLGLWPGQKVEA